MSSSVLSMPDMAASVSSRRATSFSASPSCRLGSSASNPCDQAQGLQRLAKIMAGSGEKARLGDIGLLRLALGRLQRVRGTPALGDVGEGDDDAFDPVVLGAIGQDPADYTMPVPRLDLPFDRRQRPAAPSARRRAGRCRRPAS